MSQSIIEGMQQMLSELNALQVLKPKMEQLTWFLKKYELTPLF